MPDDLRTRVERVILLHRMELADQFDNHWTCKCGATPILSAAHLADAVIRELGLRIEYGALDPTDSGRLSDDDDLVPLRGEVLKTRYITDWTEHG